MDRKLLTLLIIIIAIVAGYFVFANRQPAADNPTEENPSSNENTGTGEIMEFKTDSFVEMIDGQPRPQFSVKEISVKKGDTVRIIVTARSGSHNINIDEYGIRAETPLNEATTVEFKADKAGEFIYYCSKPGHRQNGHWGTLRVTE